MADSDIDDASNWLVDLPPTTRQNWLAGAVATVALVTFVIIAPIAGRPLAQLNAFFPSLDAIVFVTDLITSVLLFAQFSISRSRALLALATGYFFTAIIVIPHALTFSGAFSPTGLLGAGVQTGSWLFIFWHLGFAFSLFAYAALRRDSQRAMQISEVSALTAIFWIVAGTFALVFGLTWLATAGATLLPEIISGQTHINPVVIYPISFTILISAAAIAVLLTRRRTVLDQWLIVVALVYILELAFSGLFPSVRFSLGFYAGRFFSIVASSIVLFVVLAETTWLYARLARAYAMLHRERNNKLTTLEVMAASIAHEVRQSLGTIHLEGETTLMFLKQTPPDLREAQTSVKNMMSSTRDAAKIFDNILVLFGKGALKKEPVDINGLILEVMSATKSNLERVNIRTVVELDGELPPLMGHRGQLQEVILNLVHNAIEAMNSVAGHHGELKVRTAVDVSKVICIEIEDTGPGLDSEKPNTIFDAFVTTKPHGMGLGLAICRMILERHGGRLSASSANPRGAIFRIVLPYINSPF